MAYNCYFYFFINQLSMRRETRTNIEQIRIRPNFVQTGQ